MSGSQLENKVVVITGGTRGIGFAIAERLLEEGAKVAICGTRQTTVDEGLAQLSKTDAGQRDGVFGMVADVSKLEEVKRFVAAVHKRFAHIHVLVNNAGAGAFSAVADLAPEAWDRMIALNLSGAYYCCHEVLPIFKQQQGGDIINISSLAGRNPFAGGAGYNASKFGLNGFSEAMMLDHRNDGVRVTYVMPGSVATGFGGQSAGVNDAADDWKIAPGDVAEVVVTVLRMHPRTTVSRVEIRPSRPPGKS